MNVSGFALVLSVAASPASTQGFAGLGSDASGFAMPSRETTLAFPRDHGSHPEFRIEWWYLTANLTGPDGTAYGVQWTLFRSALAPFDGTGWTTPQIWMGNAGLTTPNTHYVSERFSRGGIGQSGVTADPFEAWIDDWRMAATEVGQDALDSLSLTASGTEFSYDLDLTATGPLVLQGENGYSVKSAGGQASHYYSQPFFDVTGTLTLPDGDVPVTGKGWLDREWSSQPLDETQDGWDWISLHLDSGHKLMGFRLRDQSGRAFTSATWIAPDGNATPYGNGALTLTPVGTSDVLGTDIPTRWQVDLPAQDLTLQIEALNPMSWMATTFPYWEGPVSISGSQSGYGYLEMTGYADE